MKALLLICGGLLLLAIADLPIGFYTFLRIVVTIGAIIIVFTELKNGFNFWIFAFGLVAIFFNPIIPIYLHDKEAWITIDIITAILFVLKAFLIKTTNSK